MIERTERLRQNDTETIEPGVPLKVLWTSWNECDRSNKHLQMARLWDDGIGISKR